MNKSTSEAAQANGTEKESVASRSINSLSREQKDIFCYLKNAAGNRTKFDPPLPKNTTCAVVSSSGGLKLHSLGSDIDNHDAVFRFNSNPTVGFEQHVGHADSRDNMDIRYGWAVGNVQPGEVVVTSPHDAETLQKKVGQDVHVIDLSCNSSCFRRADQAFMKLYPERYGKAHNEVTTGFNGMIIALSNCGFVDGYEITPSDAALDSRAPYNYYQGGGGVNGNSWHGFFVSEHNLWARLTTTDSAVWKQTGKTSYPGFDTIDCPNASPFPGVLSGMMQKLASFMQHGRIVVRRDLTDHQSRNRSNLNSPL